MADVVQSNAESPQPMPTIGPAKRQEVVQIAAHKFQKRPDWVSFYREILGVEGVLSKQFPEADEITAFEETDEFDQIQRMLGELRDHSKHPADTEEPTQVITVRLPKCVHESLRAEARRRRTSMNQLCISKLLQIVDGNLLPNRSR